MKTLSASALPIFLFNSLLSGEARAACPTLAIEPSSASVVAGSATMLRARGGSGFAVFAIDGDAMGASIEPGGGFRAGEKIGSVTVVARDAACKSEARAQVAVTAPFRAASRALTIAPLAAVTLAEHARCAILDGPSGATIKGDCLFVAGSRDGVYHVLARDLATGDEDRVVVTVGKAAPLAPRSPVVALPAGKSVPLRWRGGSDVLKVDAISCAGARVSGAPGEQVFEAGTAKPGACDVRVSDVLTKQTASVRVLVGEALGAPSIARGTQSWIGDMASGDVNGDGIADLIVGHAERSKTAPEAGGILVYYGKSDGSFVEPPDTIEGDHAGDRYGSVLLVRDMNGDGIDDVIAGVPDEDLGESKRGSVSLYLGAKGGLERDADRTLAGEGPNHRFGTAVAVADIDGDGALDLVASAPNARNPFANACDGGRVYVFKNTKEKRGVLAAIAAQVIDVRDTLSDAPEAPTQCAPAHLDGGRALALVDLDADGVVDLAVGAPGASYPQPNRSHGALLVYRGAAGGSFASDPSWSVHLEPGARADGASFGAALDVVGGSLVVRSPSFAPSGAAWVIAKGALGAPAAATSPHHVKNLTTQIAKTLSAPTGARGFGRSAVLADVDPRPGLEYVIGAAAVGAQGGAFVYAADEIARGAASAPLATVQTKDPDLLGFRVAALRGKPGELAGLAVWAPWRSTKAGPFVGAIDYVGASGTPAPSRWSSALTVALPSFGASDRAGTQVDLGAFDGSLVAIVGAPGSHSPAHAGHAAGERLRTGTVDLFGGDVAAPIARAFVERQDAQLGGAPVLAIDFDGDGKMELAVADPGESAGVFPTDKFVDPDGCAPLDAKGNAVNGGGRGVVRIYAVTNGALAERFRVTAPREAPRAEGPRYWLNRAGSALAVADVNGDGKQDLVIGRPGGRDASGAEVVLGRDKDPSGKIAAVCHTKDADAIAFAPATAADPVSYGAQVANLGDLDRDGCDEIALSMTRGGFPSPPRAGVAIAFGFDATGKHCGGHKTPFVLRVVPGAKDSLDLAGAPTSMGTVLARGHGDVTGDGIPDLVFRDADLAALDRRGAAVEIISGAWLASICPARNCKDRFAGLHGVGAPHRLIAPASGIGKAFGSSIAIADVTGDGVADLAIGSSDDTDAGAFAGEVRVFRGGAALTQDALVGDPWLVAVGDTTERGAFGASLAMGSGVLLVGAPMSSRNHAGSAIGAAYRFKIEAPK